MKKLLLCLLLLLPVSAFAQVNAGSYQVSGTAYLYVTTSSPSTGAPTDADAVPAYRCYTAENGTPIATGSFALIDDANTTGFYSEAISLAGRAIGDTVVCRITATVETVDGQTLHMLQVGASTNTYSWNGTAVATPATAGYPAVTIKDGTGTGEIDTLSGSIVNVDLADAVTTVNGLAANVITAAATATDAITEHQTGLYTIRKNVASQVIGVWFKSAAGANVTGLTTGQIACAISIDFGSFNTTNDTTEAEVGNGLYQITLTQAESNGDNLAINCTASGALDASVLVQTQH